uniref:Uncharacterized protein n=1 Tax=Psilocybe cubensis TaxID=181762 RepID=A0A8H7XNZ4_PSICU
MYAISHELDDAHKIFGADEVKNNSLSSPGTINLTAKNKSFDIKVTLTESATVTIKKENASTWTGTKGDRQYDYNTLPCDSKTKFEDLADFQDLNNVSGTLFTATHTPDLSGTNIFWIQQYPARKGETVGRTVVEFYTDKVITGVFKIYSADNDNIGAWGDGQWKDINA